MNPVHFIGGLEDDVSILKPDIRARQLGADRGVIGVKNGGV